MGVPTISGVNTVATTMFRLNWKKGLRDTQNPPLEIRNPPLPVRQDRFRESIKRSIRVGLPKPGRD